MRRLGVVALVLAAAVIAVPVRAADVALPPSYYPPATALPPAVYNWTAFYIGGNLGAGLLKDGFSQAVAATAAPVSVSQPFSVSPAGVVGGFQIGADYQFSSALVAGVAVSGSAASLSGTSSIQLTNVVGPPAVGERMTSNPQLFGTATGRIGYALNTLLLYAKGGAAVMRVNYTQDQIVLLGITSATQVITATRFGYTAGVGVEYAMTENLSALLEYDFMGFGTNAYNFAATPMQISSDLNTLVVGFNYRIPVAH